MAVLLDADKRWVCPNCTHVRVTPGRYGAVIHSCAGLAGVVAPLVLEGVKCRVTAHEREDYASGSRVQYDGLGRPIMSVVTERDDGQDCMILAPCAEARGASSGLV